MDTHYGFGEKIDKKEKSQLRATIRKRTLKRTPSECWDWLGDHYGKGYGRLRHNGHRISLQRALFMLFYSVKIATGVCILTCPLKRDCANPEHIGPGTSDDFGLKSLRRRQLKRTKSARSELCREAIEKIYLSDKKAYLLAKNHNTRVSYVRDIWEEKIHQDITGPLKEMKDGKRGYDEVQKLRSNDQEKQNDCSYENMQG